MARRARGGGNRRKAARPAQPARRTARRRHLAAAGQPLPQRAGLGGERPERERPTRTGTLRGRLRPALRAGTRAGPAPTARTLAGGARVETQRNENPDCRQSARVRVLGVQSAVATVAAQRALVCPRGSQRAERATAARSCARETQPLDARTTHPRSDGRPEPAAAGLERLLPLRAKQPRDGEAQRASARPGTTVAVAQAR